MYCSVAYLNATPEEKAAIITLIGVGLTVTVGLISLGLQLRHDRNLRKADQDINLAQQSFQKAVTIFNKAITLIVRSADVKVPTYELAAEFSANQAEMYSTLLIASNDTVKQINKFVLRYLKTSMEVEMDRLDIHAIDDNDIPAFNNAALNLLTKTSNCAQDLSEILVEIIVTMRATLVSTDVQKLYKQAIFHRDMTDFNKQSVTIWKTFFDDIKSKIIL